MQSLVADTTWSKFKSDEALSGEFRPLYLDYLHLLLYAGFMLVVGVIFTVDTSHNEAAPIVVYDQPKDVVAEQVPTTAYTKVFEEIAQDLSTLSNMPLLSDFSVSIQSDSMLIEFGTAIMFDPGQSSLTGEAEATLLRLADKLYPYQAVVSYEFQGYTDDVPVVSNAWKFPTNWELSGARAARVLRTFESRGFNPEHLSFTGFGKTRAKHNNRTPAGEEIVENQIRNRRLVLRIKPIE